MTDQRAHQLRLLRSANIGPITYRQLIGRFGDAEAALAALPMLAARGGGRAPRIADPTLIAREMDAVARLGARYLMLGDPDYPALLAELESAPPALIVKGREALMLRPMVAMVGARNASAAACRFARHLAYGLAESGVTIVSGLARGIDTASHVGSLEQGTIGVIASGIDVVFPPENAALQAKIAEEGLLIAEQVPGTEPLARYFPSRNRIIAGLALGTVVVEAAPRSGSLISARLAAEAGREVMAVPGSPLDPRAQGCNALIRDGATLIQNVDDVLESIGPIDRRAKGVRAPINPFHAAPAEEAGESERSHVLSLLSTTPVSVDELIRQAALSPAMVHAILLEVELAGRLERHAGARVSMRRRSDHRSN